VITFFAAPQSTKPNKLCRRLFRFSSAQHL
jgi:hypothetical protein